MLNTLLKLGYEFMEFLKDIVDEKEIDVMYITL